MSTLIVTQLASVMPEIFIWSPLVVGIVLSSFAVVEVQARRIAGVAAWVAVSGTAGFFLYWSGGTNDYGRPAISFGVEFLRMFGIAVGIGVALIVIGSLVRAAARFDMQLLNALSRHADLNRHR